MKRLLKMVLHSFAIFFEVLTVYLLSMVVLGVMPVNASYSPAADGVDIFIKSNPAHVDIVLPIKTPERDWSLALPFGLFEPAKDDFKYIAFGWGDKGFYLNTPTWADLTAETAIRAVFLPSESAMHVTLYEQTPREGKLCCRMSITREHYSALIDYIDHGFAFNDHGRPMPIDADDYPGINDRFFEGRGSYSALKTCNV